MCQKLEWEDIFKCSSLNGLTPIRQCHTHLFGVTSVRFHFKRSPVATDNEWKERDNRSLPVLQSYITTAAEHLQ